MREEDNTSRYKVDCYTFAIEDAISLEYYLTLYLEEQLYIWIEIAIPLKD